MFLGRSLEGSWVLTGGILGTLNKAITIATLLITHEPPSMTIMKEDTLNHIGGLHDEFRFFGSHCRAL